MYINPTVLTIICSNNSISFLEDSVQNPERSITNFHVCTEIISWDSLRSYDISRSSGHFLSPYRNNNVRRILHQTAATC